MRTPSNTITRWARWLATFVGFPAAGVAARLCVGDIDALRAAAIGGLVGGAALGLVQALTFRRHPRQHRVSWVAATQAGWRSGWRPAPGSSTSTDPTSLTAMGAVCGAFRRRGAGAGRADAPARPGDLGRGHARPVGPPWLITSQVIVDADRHHAVFGSSGAAAASAVAGVLYSCGSARLEVAAASIAQTGQAAV